jgi:hypothetical protein
MNTSGELGDGTKIERHTPVDVEAFPSGAASLQAGIGGFTCAVTTAGHAVCWGKGTYGNLGDGSTTSTLTPVPVSDL